MSFYREVVVWKSRHGGWYIALFDSYSTGPDPEWDVEYNFNDFEWASGPHPSQDDAWSAWPYANPGGYSLYEEPGEKTDRYDQIFETFQARVQARKAAIRARLASRR